MFKGKLDNCFPILEYKRNFRLEVLFVYKISNMIQTLAAWNSVLKYSKLQCFCYVFFHNHFPMIFTNC